MIVTHTLRRLYITYVKKNEETGKLYFGRASGLVEKIDSKSVNKIKRRRDSSHHKNKESFGQSEIDKISTAYNATKGREDMLIRKAKKEGFSGNKNNGISKRNKKREQYLNAAIDLFGDVLLGLLIYNSHLFFQ